MNKFFVAGLVICVVAAIACILSTAIPYWVYGHGESRGIDVSVAIGLWKLCTRVKSDTASETECSSIEATSWLKAVQAMMILGVIFLALSTTIACMYLWKYAANNLVYTSTVCTAVFGGVVVIIGFVVYANKAEIDHSGFSYSGGFYLAILSAILAFVAASLFAISKRSSGGYSTI